jgi:hypothetical protein
LDSHQFFVSTSLLNSSRKIILFMVKHYKKMGHPTRTETYIFLAILERNSLNTDRSKKYLEQNCRCVLNACFRSSGTFLQALWFLMKLQKKGTVYPVSSRDLGKRWTSLHTARPLPLPSAFFAQFICKDPKSVFTNWTYRRKSIEKASEILSIDLRCHIVAFCIIAYLSQAVTLYACRISGPWRRFLRYSSNMAVLSEASKSIDYQFDNYSCTQVFITVLFSSELLLVANTSSYLPWPSRGGLTPVFRIFFTCAVNP